MALTQPKPARQQQGQQIQPQQSKPPQRQMQEDAEPMQQSQSHSATGTTGNFVDPLGRPLHQTSPRFTDQQAGGDLTGDESDARDDNYVVTGHGQNARDVSAHAEELPAVSAELLRSSAAAAGPAAPEFRPAVSEQDAAAEPEPDGTEDPGANADDGLVPRKMDGTGGEQH